MPPPPLGAKTIRVLVAEDNDINRQVITAQLAQLGITAEVAENGEVALARWRQGDFQLLLTDLQMPTMDGYALAVRVRAEERSPARIPIVALTANTSDAEAARCTAAGMDEYLTKPIRLDALEAMLARVLSHGDCSAARASRPAVTASVPPSRQPSVRPPVDAEVLAVLFGDDPAQVDMLFKQIAAEAEAALVALTSAVLAGGSGAAAGIAHRLKAAARSVGARRLGNLCAHIEAADGAGDAVALASSLDLFKDEVAAIRHWVGARDASPSNEKGQD